MIMELLLLLFLGIGAWQDLKEKRIYLWVIILWTTMGIVLRILEFAGESHEYGGILAGMGIGGILFLLSLLGGQVGTGDGLAVAVMGLYLGFWDTLSVFFGASILAGITGMALCLLFHWKRNARIPFLPFLLVMNVIRIAAGG